MAIQNAQLTDTQLDVLTASANQTVAITSIMVCNTFAPSAVVLTGTSPPVTGPHIANFDMHIIKNNQALSNSVTCVIRELSLPAGETFTFDSEKVVLAPGDKLSFVGGAVNPADIVNNLTDLSVSVSYLEV
tara:strand:+ start:274 stop:666 length:393 start_codon:yes stop_codon:yes gene_type:complete